MSNKAQALIERAMSTDSEHEALACIRQAKKHWKGTPNSSSPKTQPSGGVSVAQYNRVVQAYKDAKKAFENANAENIKLRRSSLRATRGKTPSVAAYELAIAKLKQEVQQQRGAKVLRTWFFVIVIFLMIVI